jgi:hypothetical protein
MAVNLTLSVEEETLERARVVARNLGTSVNAMVRRYLEELAGKKNGTELARRFREMFAEPAGSGKPWTWNRDELYEDRLARSRR